MEIFIGEQITKKSQFISYSFSPTSDCLPQEERLHCLVFFHWRLASQDARKRFSKLAIHLIQQFVKEMKVLSQLETSHDWGAMQ